MNHVTHDERTIKGRMTTIVARRGHYGGHGLPVEWHRTDLGVAAMFEDGVIIDARLEQDDNGNYVFTRYEDMTPTLTWVLSGPPIRVYTARLAARGITVPAQS